MEEKKKSATAIGGTIFIGCMFIGMGLGMLYGKTAIGIILGMGAGMVVNGLLLAFKK